MPRTGRPTIVDLRQSSPERMVIQHKLYPKTDLGHVMRTYKPRILSLSTFKSIDWLFHHASSLSDLDITITHEDVSVDPLSSLSMLQSLVYTTTRFTKDVPDYKNLSCQCSLQVLSVNAWFTPSLAPLQRFTELRVFRINKEYAINSTIISDIHAISALTRLEQLELRNCLGDVDLEALSTCGALHTLHLFVSDIENIDGIRKCVSLTTLNLSGCRSITTLEPLSTLTRLTCLDISDTIVSSLDPCVPIIPTLVELNIISCENITRLPTKASFNRLERLFMCDCTQMTDIDSIRTATVLSELSINSCGRIAQFPDGIRFPQLWSLYANECESLLSVEFLRHSTALTHLDLRGNNRIDDFRPLSNLVTLERLYLPSDKDIECGVFDKLINLHEMNVNYI